MIQPTCIHKPFDGQVEIRLYGTPHDWSLRIPKGQDKPQQDVLDRIGEVVAQQNGVHKLYAPKATTFNAQICMQAEFTPTYSLERGDIWRGCDADGVVLSKPGKAFLVGSADCITIVALGQSSYGTLVIPAHGGRDCLVDRGRINSKEARKHESVVHAIMARSKKLGVKPGDVKVFLTCGISPFNFTHDCADPKWGQANTRMVMDIMHKWGASCLQGDPMKGKLDLIGIIRSQFIGATRILQTPSPQK